MLAFAADCLARFVQAARESRRGRAQMLEAKNATSASTRNRGAMLALMLYSLLILIACGGSRREDPNLIALTVENPTFPYPEEAIFLETSEQVTMQARGHYDNNAVEVIVAGSANWSSSDTSVATVNSNIVTAVGQGVAFIRASLDGITAQTVVVVDQVPANLVVEPVGPFSISTIPEQQFHASAFYEGVETVVEVTHSVAWTASPEGVLTFEEEFEAGTGFARFNEPGTTTITAGSGGLSGSVTIEVIP